MINRNLANMITKHCFFQSEPGNLQKKFNLSLDVHEVGELGYEVDLQKYL